MFKPSSRRAVLRAKPVALAVAAAFLPWGAAFADPAPNTVPTNGAYTAGSGTILPVTPENHLRIEQASQKGIIEWGTFSIGSAASVHFQQAFDRQGLTLNRVVGNSASEIFGSLTSNGQLFLVNNAGVLFAPGASVSAAAIVASTLSITDQHFLDGNYQFFNPGNAGSVVNQGSIVTAGGYTALIGPQVSNSGVILANSGKVALGAGDRVTLDIVGDGLLSISVTEAAANAALVNTGTIQADGGTVLLKASSMNGLLDTVINTSGIIRAVSLVESNGEIILDAGPNGGIVSSGEMQASNVSISGGSLHVQRQLPDPMLLNGLIAGDTININVTGGVLVDGGGQISSRTGQSITADSLTVRSQPGEFTTVRNESGNQAVTVTGPDGIHIEGINGGFAILGKPFVFGVPATDSQTISATRIHVQGGSIQANEQDITASAGVLLERGSISTLGRQNLSVQGALSLQSGSISTSIGGNQTITVTGGSIDVRAVAPGIGAFVTSGAAQSISVTDGDHINLIGEAAPVGIHASGSQNVSITGSGANALTLAGGGAGSRAIISAATQTITAGSGNEFGSITLTGGTANLAPASIVNSGTTVANTQTVRTSGTLAISGGTALGQTQSAGIFQNRAGQQTVSAANIVMQGGPSGSGNGAFINATFGGDQVLTVSGDLRITGGDGGTANRAGIVTNANQTINGNPNIVLTGGGGGVAGNGNNVFIQSNGDDTKLQTINAGTIELRSGAGTDASATLNAARQVITTTGDVSLFGGAGPGGLNGVRIGGIGGTTLGPTNLTLTVGGNLLLHGGTANGANLGSSGASTQSNNITVNALTGNVTLESEGAGARIGSSGQVAVTPGNIAVTAGGSLQVGNGSAVRANELITLTANDLTNAGTITNGGGANTGNMILIANAFDLAGGTIQAGAAGVFLRPRTGTNSLGIESAGATTLTNADIASINTSNFVGFGSGIGTNFTGSIAIGENAQVVGGAKNLVFFRSLSAGGTTTIGTHGVATTGDVIVAAGGGAIVSNGGTVAGDEVQLRAAQGIGAPGARVHTAANALTAGTSGDAFVTEADDVTLRTIVLNVGGNTVLNTTNTGTGGVLDLTVGGNLNVAGSVTSARSMNINAAGALNVTGAGTQDGILSSNGGQTITAQSVSVTAQDGRLGQIVNTVSGEQTITTGALSVNGGSALSGPASGIVQDGSAAQTINAASIQVQGTNAGANNGIFIRASAGDQRLNVAGDIGIAAGAGGEAWIQGSPNGQQTIHARNITMTNGIGGNNSFAALQAGHQEIHASGDVRLTGGSTGGTQGGVRMGGLRNATVVTPTDLELFVDGDVVLTGGSAPNNFAGIGSTGAFGVANDIQIEAGGVILNSSAASVARIGHGTTPGGGTIEIRADRGVELNGTTQPALIQTLGNVTLEGASISQNSNGFIRANTLTTTTSGNATLAGPNDIARYNGTATGLGSSVTVVDSGALQITGITTNKGAITLTADSLVNAGMVTNSGGVLNSNIVLNADAFNLTGGNINGGGAAVVVRPRTGTKAFRIESPGALGDVTFTNADLDHIDTSNFVVFGSGIGTTFTGNMTIGQNATVNGGTKSLAFFRSSDPLAPSGTITIGAQGVTSAADIIVGAGRGSIVVVGVIAGDEVQLRASQGIGAPGAPVRTAANALAINIGGPGSAIVTEADNVTLRTISLNVGGMQNTFGNSVGGVFDLTTGGTLDVAGVVTSGPMFITAGGALNVTGSGLQDARLISNGGQTVTAQSINLTAQNGARANIENTNGNQIVTATADGMNLLVPTGSGVAQIINNATGGNQTITANGQINVLGGVVTPTTSRNSGIFKNGLGGMQTVSASGITLQGAAVGTSAGARINSDGDQSISGGNISLIGGSGGTGNSAQISASTGGVQTINAGTIDIAAGSGGVDNSATITGGTQSITTSGNVVITGGGSTGELNGARIGGVGGNAPTATNLTLTVGGDLLMTGGTVDSAGAGLGVSSAAPTLANNITVTALSGDVILNSGTGAGARIGTPNAANAPAAGDISVTAHNIALNGDVHRTSIRTTGNVTLVANGPGGTISEAGNGFILANALTTRSTGGNTTLTGPNQVSSFNGTSSGNLSLTNTGALTVTGLNAGGDAALTNSGNVTLSGPWNSFGATSISVASDLNINSFVQSSGPMTLDVDGAVRVMTSGTQDASLTSFAGQTIDARSLEVAAFDGRLASVGNMSGTQTIRAADGMRIESNSNGQAVVSNQSGEQIVEVSGAGIDVIRNAGGGTAMLGKPFVFGVPATDSQTITTTRLNVERGSFQAGRQDLRVSGDLSVQNGAITSGGDQRITVSNGSIDVRDGQIWSGIASGGSQTISVTDGDHISVDGGIFSASIFASGGAQTVSITGNGANAIRLGSSGALGFSQIAQASTQNVTAGLAGEQGSITIVGSDAVSALAGFVSNPSVGGTQTISTPGTISITGGRAPTQLGNFPAGIFHNGTGQQTINAAAIVLTGGPSGNNNAALINVPGGGVPANAAAQVVNVSGDITIAGGPGGNAGILGSASRQQTVHSHNISLTNSAGGGINSVGFILGGHQDIHAAGDVTLTARASGGDLPGVRIGGLGGTNVTPTDLQLFVGRDLVLTAGTAANNGVGIGSTAAGTALANQIHIETGRDVILNSGTAAGTGARIGSSAATGAAPGNITILAGGDIRLNGVDQGTAIRTLDTVTLNAANISEASNGRIIAGTLNTTTSGNTLLTGRNEVSNFRASSTAGDVTLSNDVAVNVSSLNAAGNAAVSSLENVTLMGHWSSTTASITAGGTITESGGGSIQASSLSTNSAGATSLIGPNRISNFSGFSNGALSLTNSGALTVNSFFAMLGNGTLTNAGDVSVTGGWNSQAAKIDTTGNLSVTGSVSSNGFMEIDVDGTLTVTASGQLPPPTPGFPDTPRIASLTSLGGQDIDAGGIKVIANDGAFATISNNGVPPIGTPGQKIVVGASGIEVRSAGTVLPSNPQSSAQISNSSSGNQEITVAGGGINVISTAGNASISSSGPFLPPPPPGGGTPPPPPPGSQTITVTDGPGIDVIANGGSATITQNAQGGAQSITTINADHIALDGHAGFARISNFLGAQTISITGTGSNALRVGSAGGQGLSQVLGRTQSITAGDAARGEAGRIDVVGTNAPASFVGITTSNAPGAGNIQTVSTAGTITIQGGNTPAQILLPVTPPVLTSSNTGISHNSSGQQTIVAGGITLQGGTGVNNGAFISSGAGGHQHVTITGGSIALTGGSAGSNNFANINTNADQEINVAGGSITLASGAGGVNSSAAISGTKQFINTTGDVIMTGGASTGQFSGTRIGGLGGNTVSPTDLTLNIGGSLRMTGGSAEFNGASIGSTLSTPAQPNLITINAAGDVILSPGSAGGARVGTSVFSDTVADGVIAINAGGRIELNGNTVATPTVIRTLGNVTLNAGGTISEGSHGFVQAGGLTTSSGADTALTGPNQIARFNATSAGGGVSLNNTGVLNVTGMAVAGDATITNIGNVTVSGPWTAGGTSSITVGSDILVNAAMVSPEVVLVANDGAIIEAPTGSITADTLTTVSSGETRLVGANDVEVFNSTSFGGLAFNNTSGALTLGNIETNGGAFSLGQTGDVKVNRQYVFGGPISMAVGGSLRVHGGSAPGSAAEIAAHGPIEISTGANLSVMGGSGDGAFARILGYSDINLTVGGFITLGAGTGVNAWARVQLDSRDSVIRIHFPNLASGGYFVNGIEGLLRDGHTGFLAGNGVAAPGHQFITIYGAP